jgi:glutamyl/glutaminyl-tRNA synthetase
MYFFKDPETYDEKALEKHWKNNERIKPIFKKYCSNISAFEIWTPEEIEENLRFFAESEGIKAGELIHILRLTLTGISISPGIFELMCVLGKDKVISRISGFITKI